MFIPKYQKYTCLKALFHAMLNNSLFSKFSQWDKVSTTLFELVLCERCDHIAVGDRLPKLL